MIPLSKNRGQMLRWLGPAVVLLLMAGSLWLLHKQLAHTDFREVKAAVWSIPRSRLLAALGLTAVAYALLPGYDFTALAYVGKKLPARRVELAGFLAYGISQTLGFPLVTGSGIRYRLWSSWGLSTAEIAEAIAFANATHTICAGAVIGTALVLEPRSAVELLKLPAGPLRPVGAICVLGVIAYLWWSARHSGKPLRFRGWEFPVPPVKLTLIQLVVAAVDWVIGGAVLYLLLPKEHGIGFAIFIGAFLISLFAGLISHVPGGVGVFETMMVLLLSEWIPAPEVLGRLVAYRAVFYLVPFFVAVVMLAVYEVRTQRGKLAAAAAAGARWVPSIIPQVLGVTTFLGGALLLLSGSTPEVGPRMSVLADILPLGVIELSHFAASLAGAGLIVLAWGLSRRLDAAWGLAVLVLLVGIVASVLRGLDWEDAVALGVPLALLLPSHRAFYRKTTLLSEPFTPEWVVAIVLVVGATLWLGSFAYRHVEYSDALWWRFTARGDAPRFLRASVGVVAVLGVFALLHLLRHAKPEPHLATVDELERARELAARLPDAHVGRALRGDLDLLFSRSGNGMLPYGVRRKTWVALGDPLGPEQDRAELAWTFREEANLHGAVAVFHEVSPRNVRLYGDLGLTLLEVGEEAVVPLAGFSLHVPGREEVLQGHLQMRERGATLELVPAEQVAALLPAVPRAAAAAAPVTEDLPRPTLRPDEAAGHLPAAVVRVQGKVVGFASLWRGADRQEVAVDDLRLAPDAPEGTLDYLFAELALQAQARGYERLSLGTAPLPGPPDRVLGDAWRRYGALLFPHGEHFVDAASLRAFKQRFAPTWETRYLASPGGLALPRILADVASLVSTA
jgi:phosphatidylglycerol lysyltransferase